MGQLQMPLLDAVKTALEGRDGPAQETAATRVRLFNDLSAKPDICSPMTAGSPTLGSQMGSQRRQAVTDARRRLATIGAGRWLIRRRPATVRDGRIAPEKPEGRRFDPAPDHTSSLICGNATLRNRVRRPPDAHSADRASADLSQMGPRRRRPRQHATGTVTGPCGGGRTSADRTRRAARTSGRPLGDDSRSRTAWVMAFTLKSRRLQRASLLLGPRYRAHGRPRRER